MRSKLFTCVALITAFGAGTLAGAQRQAPHTRREPQFENDQVRVWKSIILPNQPLALHRHDHGRTIVALKGGTLDVVDAQGKTTKQMTWESGKAYWLGPDPPGEQHGDMNRGKEPIEVIVVEMRQTPAPADASRLRSLFFQRDYETGAIEGAKAALVSGVSSDGKAWHVLNLARADRADRAAERRMGGPGSRSAVRSCTTGGQLVDAIAAAEKALQLLPGDPDAIRLRAQSLAGDPKRCEEAVAFATAIAAASPIPRRS